MGLCPAFLCVGMKHGDILSVLPAIHSSWVLFGEKPQVVVGKPYGAALDRALYVDPVEYPGDWQDLRGAIVWAKRRFGRVICPSTFGKDFPIQKRLPSFQLDQWDRAMLLGKWDTLPLVLERPANAAELVKEHLEGKPCILLGDYSESSPFPEIEDLAGGLAQAFPGHRVLRLSAVRLEHPFDFVALYDSAAALVTVETMHAHLCKASNIPAVVLATDKPSRWHGSAWSQSYRLHVRYSDYALRRGQILQAVRDAIDGVAVLTPRLLEYAAPLAYNPSIMDVKGARWTTWRHHPDQHSWRTVMSLHDGQSAKPIVVDGFEDYSIEDGRLFMFAGKPHLSAVVARSGASGQPATCICGYGELIREDKQWTIRNFIRPAYGRNDFNGMEKNHVYFEWGGKLFCIYQTSPEQIVLELSESRVVKAWKSQCPEVSYGLPKGGTSPVPIDGYWLRFFHTNQRNPKSDQWWTYHMGALVMQPNPPFNIIQISQRPILTGNERFFPDHRYWKPRCFLPFGVVEESGGWTVSVGWNDSACAVITLNKSNLYL